MSKPEMSVGSVVSRISGSGAAALYVTAENCFTDSMLACSTNAEKFI